MNSPVMDIAPAHSPFGGSSAPRILKCPASVRLIAGVPAHLRKTSVYAQRGSSLHAAMSLLIERQVSLEELVGKTLEGYTFTADDVENSQRPALAYVDELLDTPGAEYFIEQRVRFPGIADTFGTCDLLIRIGNIIYVIDFKFGAGVRVLALYPEGDDDVVNAQLAFYATAARYSLPNFFAGVEDIVLTILQPVSIDLDAPMVSSVAVTPAELDEFIEVYSAACAEALSEKPRLARGPHCRFCSARPSCPEHCRPLLDFAQFALPAPTDENYYELLAAGLELLDATRDLGTALRDQAKAALDAGGVVPGYALSAGRAVRAWRDEAAAAPNLLKLELARDDVLVETLRSPKQIETRAKARGVKVPSELIISRPSGVSLVRAENVRRLVPGRNELARAFTQALSAFQKGSRNGQG